MMLSWSMDVFFAKQLLFASWQNVVFAGAVFLSATALVYTRPELFLKKYFYIVLACVITTSVQICGVYLVFASLIFPAVATSYMTDERNTCYKNEAEFESSAFSCHQTSILHLLYGV